MKKFLSTDVFFLTLSALWLVDLDYANLTVIKLIGLAAIAAGIILMVVKHFKSR